MHYLPESRLPPINASDYQPWRTDPATGEQWYSHRSSATAQTVTLADMAKGCNLSPAEVLVMLDAAAFEPVVEANYGRDAAEFLAHAVLPEGTELTASTLAEIATAMDEPPAAIRATLDLACIDPLTEAAYGIDAADYLIAALDLATAE